MNTIRSTWYGWGVLIVAGAGSYYFAKKQVNADRAERQEAELRRRRMAQRMEERARLDATPRTKARSKGMHHTLSPSGEASNDPAPTTHSAPPPETLGGTEKSKYEPTEPFRSRKGDRFS